MIHSRILSACFISFIIAACDTQEQPAPVEKTTEPKMIPEKTTTKKIQPALNLSIDNLPIEQQSNDGNSLTNDRQPTEKDSALFKTLNKKKTDQDINLSGKVFTDKDKLDNKEYLDAVDGVQINIEGNFE